MDSPPCGRYVRGTLAARRTNPSRTEEAQMLTGTKPLDTVAEEAIDAMIWVALELRLLAAGGPPEDTRLPQPAPLLPPAATVSRRAAALLSLVA